MQQPLTSVVAIVGALLLAGLGWLMSLSPAQDASHQVVQLREASFALSGGAAPPPTGWARQTLPDSWRESRPGVHGHGWYRMAVSLPQPPQDLHALYLPLVNSAFQLWVNGVLVADSGGTDGPNVGRSAGFPQWATVPPQALRQGANDVLLRLRVAPNLRGGLAAPYFGPQQMVRELFDADHLLRVAVPRTLNAAVLVLGLLVLLLWSRSGGEALYGWCGGFLVVSAVWSLRNFDIAFTLPEVPSRVWETFVLSGLAIARLMLLLFVLRFTGLICPRAERATLAAMVLLPVALYAVGEGALSTIRTPFYVACGVPMWLSIALLVRYAIRRGNEGAGGGALLVLAAVVASELLAVHDWLVAINWLPFGTQRWQDYASVLLTVGLVGALARRYFAAFDTARTLNRELEARVQQKAQALEDSMRKVAAFELDSALNRERQRLMRDMHDGIGSQLITMTGAVERGTLAPAQVARLLRDCIDDLRLVIDSLEPDHGNLAAALANLRYRVGPRLEAAGLSLHWETMGVADDLDLPPGRVLQVLRIVQEALTNALRHSGARRVDLAVSCTGGLLQVRVADDGSSPQRAADAPVTAGRGLTNMRQRATAIGGTLDLSFTPQGAEVLLRVPLG